MNQSKTRREEITACFLLSTNIIVLIMSVCDGLHECKSVAQQSLWSGEVDPSEPAPPNSCRGPERANSTELRVQQLSLPTPLNVKSSFE